MQAKAKYKVGRYVPALNSMNPLSNVEVLAVFPILARCPVISSSDMSTLGTCGMSFLGYFGGRPRRLLNASLWTYNCIALETDL